MLDLFVFAVKEVKARAQFGYFFLLKKNEKFLKFNMNGENLIKVEAWDYDAFSKDDLIGTGYISSS